MQSNNRMETSHLTTYACIIIKSMGKIPRLDVVALTKDFLKQSLNSRDKVELLGSALTVLEASIYYADSQRVCENYMEVFSKVTFQKAKFITNNP
jgi:hypothetical protein